MSVPTPAQLRYAKELGADSDLIRTSGEASHVIVWLARERGKESKRKGSERLKALLESKGLRVGGLVTWDPVPKDAEVYTIKKITADSYLLLEEQRGKFHPTSLTPAK